MILTVTLNPAIDKFYQIRKLEPGQMARVQTCTSSAGGKGINVAKAASLMGEPVLAMGFAGGYAGQYLKELLRDYSVQPSFTEVSGETRSCISVRDMSTGEYTEFLEPGQPVSLENWEKLVQDFRLAVTLADAVALSGSLPPGVPEDAYSILIRAAAEKGKPVLLDTSGEALLQAIKEAPSFIKPNEREAGELTGKAADSLEAAASAAAQLRAQGIQTAVVSMGKAGAVMACESGIYLGIPPELKAVNTVGCGDSMVAGFAVGFARGFPPVEQLRYGLASSAANALTAEIGSFKPRDFRRFLKMVQVKKWQG